MAEKDQTVRTKTHQVFLSYADADREVARKITDELRAQDISVWFSGYELRVGDSIASAIEQAISASDYLVVLLSPHSVNSRWMQEELNAALTRELTARDVTLLPVLIGDCEIPSLLASRHYFDLRSNLEQGVKQLVEQIGLIPDIDFSQLDAKSFEQLVLDLLRAVGFTEIETEWEVAGRHVDIKALYPRTDPFGAEVRETWLVEVKFYLKSRADLQSIHQLTSYLLTLPEHIKGLLITNGQITSTARQWLESIQNQSRIEIRVLDGTDLKRLLLQHKNLVYRYFMKNTEGPDE